MMGEEEEDEGEEKGRLGNLGCTGRKDEVELVGKSNECERKKEEDKT